MQKIVDKEWIIKTLDSIGKTRVLHLCAGDPNQEIKSEKTIPGFWPVVNLDNKLVCMVCKKEAPNYVKIYL